MNSGLRTGLLAVVVAMALLALLKGCLSPISTEPSARPDPTPTAMITATEGITGTVAPTLTTAPTSSAVHLARAWQMCIAGYVRHGGLRVYTHPQRLGLPQIVALSNDDAEQDSTSAD